MSLLVALLIHALLFTYTQMSQDCIKGNRITFSKIGDVKIILHRPIPDSFKIKTAQIVKNADGWYVVLTLQDVTVPTISPDINLDNAVGIDMGLKDFLITSDAETVPIPQLARKAEIDKKLRNKAVSRKKKGIHILDTPKYSLPSPLAPLPQERGTIK